jgi:phosphatidylglycerophosphatase A
VVDELVGMLVALAGSPWRIGPLLLRFGCFRWLDVWKPYPVKICERWGGGFGVVADDVAAGLLANLLVRALGLGLGMSL